MTSNAGSGGDVDGGSNANVEPDDPGTTESESETEFAVSREGTALVTLHEGTDTTARREATVQLTDAFETVSSGEPLPSNGRLAEWTVGDATVYEHPTAPFDPYTIAVTVSITAVVSANGAEAAESIGSDAIDAVLESTGIGDLRDGSSSVTVA